MAWRKSSKRRAAWWGGVAVYNISHCLGVPMDDIVWIRDDAQVDDSIPVSDQLPSGDVPSTTATQAAEEEPETFVEIPVIYQPKSTEVRFYPTDESKDNEREGSVPVEIYKPFSNDVSAQSGKQNGGGNAIVISLLFRGQGNGEPPKQEPEPSAKPQQEVLPHEIAKPQEEVAKPVEKSQADQVTAGEAQSATDLANEQSKEPKKEEAKPSETIQTVPISNEVPAPPAPTPEIKQEAAQPEAEPQKQESKQLETIQPSQSLTAAEPAVINLQFKEPSQKKEEPQKSPEIKEPAAASAAAEPAVISIVYKEPPKQKPSSEGAPVQVEVFSPLDHPAELDKIVEEAAEEPVLIDHNTPEILEEAAQKLVQFQEEEKKPAAPEEASQKL
ncbi:hypothetical protein TELCIR_08306 [Teladorsagia circumcincta]|uniref:Uncharacterized protein n=1 Tax=Teladorsagia circumcincta TaxID=45464 RepID=A0A2G9UHZ2_TELCI|nr:hypothetical protein TELCIR_08306 [Teladorsagia circumcincta]